MSGWCPCSSARPPTRLVKSSSSRKFLKRNSFSTCRRPTVTALWWIPPKERFRAQSCRNALVYQCVVGVLSRIAPEEIRSSDGGTDTVTVLPCWTAAKLLRRVVARGHGRKSRAPLSQPPSARGTPSGPTIIPRLCQSARKASSYRWLRCTSPKGLPSESRHTAQRSAGWTTSPPAERTRARAAFRSSTEK
jgi:hypothetical protein